MTITRNFKLCLNAGTGLAPYINVNQFDQGEQWVFTLYQEDGTQYTPSTGAIVGIKADHFGIINTGTVVDGKVVINETQQMTAAAGKAIFELQIDGDTHGTANFIVMVEPKPGNNANYSDSDISGIQQAIDAANLINELADAGEEPKQFIIDEVDAWLDNHPEATTTVLDGAITAPKINQSLWDKLLVSEEASGNPASFDDGADDVPVSSLKVALEPIQLGSGDPSPSNIRPIVAANGKNLLPNNLTFTSGTRGDDGSHSSSYLSHYSEKISINPSTEYTLQVPKVEGISIRVYYLTSTEGWISRTAGVTAGYMTFTTPSNCYYIQIQCAADVTLAENAQLEYGNSPTAIQPYQGIMVDVQSGNLAHLIDETRTGQGITSTVASEKITATGTATSTYANLNYLHPINIVNGQTYTVMLSKAISNAIVFRFATDTSDSTYQQVTINAGSTKATFTASNNFALFRVYIGNLTSGTAVNISDLQILVGNGDISAFVPYSLTSYPYTLGQSVYGGTVDLATGVLTVTWTSRTMNGSENWARENGSATHYKYYINANDIGKPIGNNYKAEGTIICDKLITAVNSFDYTTDSIAVTAWANHSVDSNYLYLIVNNAAMGFDTADGLKAWLASNPLQVAYKLATPQTIQLTPQEVKTLLGYNNISSTGTVEVIYHADTKLYVDKMTNVDNAIIAPTEEGFTATRNYTVNDLVIVNDTLYKVTANIASGSAITPNSNVQQTTLSALIKALS